MLVQDLRVTVLVGGRGVLTFRGVPGWEQLVVIVFEFFRTLQVDFVDVAEGRIALENLLGGQLSRDLVLFGLDGASRSKAAKS